MALFPTPTLIRSANFPKENEALVGQLGLVLNRTLEQIYSAFNKGIDFNNLNQEVVAFSVKVDSNGIPQSTLEIVSSLKTKIQGTICINVTGASYPTSNPLVSFEYSSSSNSITIKHITGLAANTSYTLSLILIG
jgi:hypothetical protein